MRAMCIKYGFLCCLDRSSAPGAAGSPAGRAERARAGGGPAAHGGGRRARLLRHGAAARRGPGAAAAGGYQLDGRRAAGVRREATA